MKTDLLDLTKAELTELVLSLGEAKFRAGQIYDWLHRGYDIHEMTNISKSLREKLAEVAFVTRPNILKRARSAIDGTVKYLFEMRYLLHVAIKRFEIFEVAYMRARENLTRAG